MPAARIGSAIYLVLLLAFCVWRAATQSFSTDEAYSYQLYVGKEPFNLFRQYDANLHLLHTWLCWASVRVFGLSELAFRLPSLAGAAIYFAGVYRLCSMAVLSASAFVIGVVVLTVNPLVLDHMIVARGYGLALGFFAWAFAESLKGARPRVAVFMALSVASNLVFLFPCAALIAAIAVTRRDWRGVLRNVAAPAAVLTFLAWILPMSVLEPGAFYFGSQSLTEMIQPLAEMSIGGRHVDPILANCLATLALGGAIALLWRERARLFPALFASATPSETFARLSGSTLVFTIALVLASHYVGDAPLPYGRTGIYFLFLVPLCLLAAGRWALLPACFLIVAMASGIHAKHFQEWPFDAPLREMVADIESRHKGPSRVVATGPMEMTVGLYKTQRGLNWMAVERLTEPLADAEFYILGPGDAHYMQEKGLRPIAGSPQGTTLAARQ